MRAEKRRKGAEKEQRGKKQKTGGKGLLFASKNFVFSQDGKIKPGIIFLAKFFVVFFVFEWLLTFLRAEPLQDFIASSQAAFFGLKTSTNLIFVEDGIFEINSSCTGLVSSIILGAIVFSLKKPELPKKIAIFLSGALLLVFLNYFRVMAVIFVGVHYGMRAAEIVHVISWFSTTAFVIGIWYLFTKRISKVKNFAGFL